MEWKKVDAEYKKFMQRCHNESKAVVTQHYDNVMECKQKKMITSNQHLLNTQAILEKLNRVCDFLAVDESVNGGNSHAGDEKGEDQNSLHRCSNLPQTAEHNYFIGPKVERLEREAIQDVIGVESDEETLSDNVH